MDWRDELEQADEETTQPKIKPRRIDAPHPSVPAGQSSIERHSSVPAHVGGEEGLLAADETPVFYEVAPTDLTAAQDPPAGPEPPAGEDLSLQTEQLARALAEQLRDLDAREALLSTRAGELETEWRSCQAWHQRQLAELNEREAELSRRAAEMDVFTRREEELAERCRDCEAQELALDQREAKLNEREATLVARDHELRDRRQQVEREAAGLSRSQQLWEQSKSRDEQALARQGRQLQIGVDEQLAERLAEVEQAKALLAEQARALEQDRQSLRREQGAWQQQRKLEEDRRGQQQRQTQHESQRRLAAITTRESALDTQQAALEQLRGEMTGAYRQALEMRLIAEQIWTQLKGLMTPAEITQSLAQLRLKMAEQYELEEKALAERKEELLALADKLAQQHAALKAQRMEFLAWRKAQQEEIAHQAEHLCRRVQDLSEERKQLRQAA